MHTPTTQPQIENPALGLTGLRQSSGLSLISTLWILTVLSVLAMQMLYSFRLENTAQGNFMDRVKHYYAAKSGFEWAVAKLAVDETNFDSLGEAWAEPIQQQIEDGIQTGGLIDYQVTITDEATKINLNAAEEDQIRNLLSYLGYQPEINELGDLATRIVEGRPYRTVRDIARVEGMTDEVLYGLQQQQPVAEETTSGTPSLPDAPETVLPPTLTMTSVGGLVNVATIYSVDTNTDANGGQRVNINSANANQIQQIRSNNNQNVFSQGEANAIIQSRNHSSLSALLDVQAVSDNVFNNIQDQISIEDSVSTNDGGFDSGFDDGFSGGSDDEFGGGRNNNNSGEDEGDSKVNINAANSQDLQELDGIDGGIADRIIAHRNSQGNFQNIDAIKQVKLMTVRELAGIVDKITVKDGNTVNGLININTAPVEILQLLPGMDQTKAQAIVTRREEENPDAQNQAEDAIKGNPFSDIGQLLDIEEIDDNSFREVVDWVTYRSHGYRIVASGVDASGKVIATCVGIVVRNGNQLTIPYWRQD